MKQNTPEWLEHRKSYIGSSDAPVIMGVSPWKTPYQLWQEKIGFGLPEEQDNPAIRRGNALEEEARQLFSEEIGAVVQPYIGYHPQFKFMMASLDGISPDGQTIVEIKCPGEKGHELARQGVVPDHYYPQLQHQLAVMGTPMLWYYSYYNGEGIKVAVERDDKYIDKLIQAEAAFWQQVKELKAPEPTSRDYQLVEDGEWDLICEELFQAEEQLQVLSSHRDALRQALIEKANGRSCKGGGVTLTKTFPKGRVQYTKIPELAGVDLEKYRAPSKVVWRLQLNEQNNSA